MICFGVRTSVTRIGSIIWASRFPAGGATSCAGFQIHHRSRRWPTRHFSPRVILFTVEFAARADRPVGRELPRPVAHNHLFTAVIVLTCTCAMSFRIAYVFIGTGVCDRGAKNRRCSGQAQGVPFRHAVPRYNRR